MSEGYVNYIDARCVTIEDLYEVARWCMSSVGIMYEQDWLEGQHYIQVGNERAIVGDWIVTDGVHFTRITDEEYKQSFEAAKRNRKKYIEILEIVSDAISEGALHQIHGIGVDRDIVAERATLRIMQIL